MTSRDAFPRESALLAGEANVSEAAGVGLDLDGSDDSLTIDSLIAGASDTTEERGQVVGIASLESTQLKLLDLRNEDHQTDTTLKKWLGIFAIAAMGAQLLLANAGFGVYLWWMQWQHKTAVPPEVMIAWFTATVVEVIGVVLVVAKYLFPGTGNNWNHEHRSAE